MRVNSVHHVIQKTLRLQAEAGILEWPSNIPSGEVWIEAIEDKGGGARIARELTTYSPAPAPAAQRVIEGLDQRKQLPASGEAAQK